MLNAVNDFSSFGLVLIDDVGQVHFLMDTVFSAIFLEPSSSYVFELGAVTSRVLACFARIWSRIKLFGTAFLWTCWSLQLNVRALALPLHRLCCLTGFAVTQAMLLDKGFQEGLR